MMNRRDAIKSLTAAAALAALPSRHGFAQDAPKRTTLGLVTYACGHRRGWLRKQDAKVDLFEPFTFLEHCRSLGAGGMQHALGTLSDDAARKLRAAAEKHSLFIEAIISPPRDEKDVARFESQVKTAVAVGCPAARTVIMPGRRYEQFDTRAEFDAAVARGKRMLEMAAPIVEKHRLPLAVENHKDQRSDERVALFKAISSEFVGACVDTGNSMALLEDPRETAAALAPYAFSVHLKDQAVMEYDEGFLLGDIPLGQGCIDLKSVVAILKKANPKVNFALELITRDALKVPVLTQRYWATLDNAAKDDVLWIDRLLSTRAAKELQQVSSLSEEERVKLEDANVATSLKYAREELGLT